MKPYDPVFLVALAAAPAMSGCGSASIDHDKLTDARAAVRAAEEVGAQELPDAALHLKLAEDQIAKAEELYRKDAPYEGSRMLDRAEVDAELALSLAEAASVREKARKAQERIQELKQGEM